MKPIFVTGTDTGIGKTVFSLLLMRILFEKGFEPFYLKPFQTGCAHPNDANSDASFVYKHVPQLSGMNPANSVVFCFPAPKAPMFAARDAGQTIDLSKVMNVVEEKRQRFSPLVIEGAGGLMVPILENVMMADLIEMTNSVPILVARAGLGTINHTLLSVSELVRRNLGPAGIVLIDRENPGTPEAMIRENKEAIESFSGVQVLGVIGRIRDFSDSDVIMRISDQIFEALNYLSVREGGDVLGDSDVI